MKKYSRYQDYVIRDGEFVGDFESMYQDHEDPWHQSAPVYTPEKLHLLATIKRLSIKQEVRIIDIGCGLGAFTVEMFSLGLPTLGIDLSPTAISKASNINPGPKYAVGDLKSYELFESFRPTLFVMVETAWYVLDQLRSFRDYLLSAHPNAHLLLSLNFLPTSVQEYGRDYFTTPAEMRDYFELHYVEFGDIRLEAGNTKTFFLADVGKQAKSKIE